MKFSDIINAGISKEVDRPMMKKELYPPSETLKKKLKQSKIIVFLFALLVIHQSCCPNIKEESLGNNFYLSEYDNVDRRILYSEESCSNSGIEIVPMTVTEYAYNSKWIIAKSASARQTVENNYWIVDKFFKVKIEQENDSTLNVIKSHIFGPFDSTKFIQILLSKEINLTLKKILSY